MKSGCKSQTAAPSDVSAARCQRVRCACASAASRRRVIAAIVVPAEPDQQWLREQLVRRLIYVCESEGVPVPECSGTIVELFVGPRL